MSSSSKKPGAGDISDLKARLGLAKSKDGAGPKEAEPAGAVENTAAPAPMGAPMASPSAAPMAAPVAPSPIAPMSAPGGFGPANNPLTAPAYAPPVAAAPAPVEDDRYDYEPPPVPDKPDFDPNQFDPSIKQPRSMGKLVTVGIIIGLLLASAFAVGMVFQNILQDRTAVNRRISLAQKMHKDIGAKVNAFTAFLDPFKQKWATAGPDAAASFDQQLLAHMEKSLTTDFALDIATVPPEAIILGQAAGANPLAELRQFSAGSMLTFQLVSSHISQTKQEWDELSGRAKADDIFALRFDIRAYEMLVTSKTPTPTAQAISAAGLFRVDEMITEEGDMLQRWAELRGPVPEDPKKKDKDAEVKDLPPVGIYKIVPQYGGKAAYVLADELITIRRDALFGSTSGAIDRYKQRVTQILKVASETEKVLEPLVEKLQKQASEELI